MTLKNQGRISVTVGILYLKKIYRNFMFQSLYNKLFKCHRPGNLSDKN